MKEARLKRLFCYINITYVDTAETIIQPCDYFRGCSLGCCGIDLNYTDRCFSHHNDLKVDLALL